MAGSEDRADAAAPLVEQRDEIVERCRETLRRAVRDRGVSQRQIEERNGFTRGYLSQVLHGHITLTVRHFLGIALALGEDPGRLLDRALGGERDRWPAEVRQRLERYDDVIRQLEDRGLVDPPDG